MCHGAQLAAQWRSCQHRPLNTDQSRQTSRWYHLSWFGVADRLPLLSRVRRVGPDCVPTACWPAGNDRTRCVSTVQLYRALLPFTNSLMKASFFCLIPHNCMYTGVPVARGHTRRGRGMYTTFVTRRVRGASLSCHPPPPQAFSAGSAMTAAARCRCIAAFCSLRSQSHDPVAATQPA